MRNILFLGHASADKKRAAPVRESPFYQPYGSIRCPKETGMFDKSLPHPLRGRHQCMEHASSALSSVAV